MKLDVMLYMKRAENDLADKIRTEIERLVADNECELSLREHIKDGVCMNCGKETDLLWTESFYTNGNMEEVSLCRECDEKYLDREKNEGKRLIDDFKAGRG